MSYNSSAEVQVVNNTGGTANVHLSHQYSDDPTQQKTWNNVSAGDMTSGTLSVGYNTGFIRSGHDYWWIGVEVLDGPHAGNYSSTGSADDPGKTCTLESEDDGKTLTFTVTTETFVMQEISGGCSTGMSSVGG